MPEDIEEIVIIEHDDYGSEHDDEESGDSSDGDSDTKSDKKKKVIIFSAIGVALLLIAITLAVVLSPDEKIYAPLSMSDIDEKLEGKKKKPIPRSKLEQMITKANYLYSNGQKSEALFIYEKIAEFSEAVSFYNLGVAQLKEKQYKIAMESFKKAIKNDEKRCVSALNSAVCAMELNDKESFRYYIDLAYAYLPNEVNSPLYSYYYTLINYYNRNYFEALSSLSNPTSKEYKDIQKHLKAKIDAMFENNYGAIESIEDELLEKDVFSLGLLYARVGDITLAKQHLEDAIFKNIQPAKAELALGYLNLKAGFVSEGSTNIKNVTDMFPDEVYKSYPITVSLKSSLFDAKRSQKEFRDHIEDSKAIAFQKLWYFTPYKIFNVNQSISYIRRGNANIYIDNTSTAKEYLRKSASSSTVNAKITKAIQKAIDFKVREANEEFSKLIKIQPKHSILRYNLALSFAQLGDIVNADKHFLRSYHLDAKNYLSGIFALMSGELLGKDRTKLKGIIKLALSEEEPSEELSLYRALLSIIDKDSLSSVDWLSNKYKNRPLYLALEIAIAKKLGKYEHANLIASKLINILPREILPHIIYMDTAFYKLDEVKYARAVTSHLREQNFHYRDLYFGTYVTRYLYIQQSLIIGRLYHLRERLKNVIYKSKGDKRDIVSTLALASLYNEAFEESYTLYNQLIDDLKVRDANTLFLAATASIGAKHPSNAIALLELSKRKDGSFLESRYALGLLYLQIQNNEGATIQLSKIGNNFRSKFFNFDINQEKLLFEKLNSEKNSK